MKLTSSLLLSAVFATAFATSEANVYLFQADSTPSSNPPSLSPEQARLVLAQRLRVSKYHSIGDTSAETISYINSFGSQQRSLFVEPTGNEAAELVLILDGVSSQVKEEIIKAWASPKVAFSITGSPSSPATTQLVDDLSQQIGQGKICSVEDQLNPYVEHCWTRKSRIVRYNLAGKSAPLLVETLKSHGKKLAVFASQEDLNALVLFLPESKASREQKNPYGVYDMPIQAQLGRRQAEEPITAVLDITPVKANEASYTRSNSSFKPITGVPALCHATLDACSEKTNNCSGHGKCYRKRGKAGKDACFTCGCVAQNQTFIHGPENRTGHRLVYWGGAACQKKDVSGPFWLLATFTVVLIGLVGWAIGLMYSIGEEKLPGVIGAGVSSNRAR